MAKPHARARAIDGILLLDKPLGLSSNQALQTVKNIYFAQKAGHTGSLDPRATGMLPLCFGEATKFSQFLLDADKEYLVTAKLGVRTTTCDSEGEIIAEQAVGDIDQAKIELVLQKFRGEIQQVPSMFSALKHQGQPLYKLARQGIEVERKPRPLTIYQLELLSFDLHTANLNLRVKCSKGTYIRNLVDDIGMELGCGAYVIELRRTSVSHFQATQMVTLSHLEQLRDVRAFVELDQLILPLDDIGNNLPALQLSSSAAHQLQHGQEINTEHLPLHTVVRLFYNEKFIGIGEVQTEGKLVAKRMLQL